MPNTCESHFSAVFPEFRGAEVHGSCFSSVFAVKFFELAVKTDEKQTEKQPKNITVSIPNVM